MAALDINRANKKNLPAFTTKICVKCWNTQLLILSTLNKKICTDCDNIINWPKDKDQPKKRNYL